MPLGRRRSITTPTGVLRVISVQDESEVFDVDRAMEEGMSRHMAETMAITELQVAQARTHAGWHKTMGALTSRRLVLCSVDRFCLKLARVYSVVFLTGTRIFSSFRFM